MTRHDILMAADQCVNGDREEDYGKPEDNFALIAKFWNAYLGVDEKYDKGLDAMDVACMMALMKIARINSGRIKADNFIDLAGYAACGGEIATQLESSEN